jgi:excisionase family DNA binding protein
MPDHRCQTMTVEEAAEVLGISRAFAYSLVKQDQLPCIRLGRRVVVPRRALEHLLHVDLDTPGPENVSTPNGPSESAG